MPRQAILVIDDDEHLVEVIQQYLEAKGFLVHTALDGLHAYPLAQIQHPVLIIMDVDMPIVSGLKALEQLRADPKTQEIPVIMLSGLSSGRVYPYVEKMARVSHIKKPVSLKDLYSMIRHFLPDGI